ncbi:MAG: PilT/PilU family type 4a pilus ATPase [Chloroflexi bacterium]|nr:PilT/PilU family type 4a pilus ATPase [Chloroflexota bacterium]
MNIKLLLEKAKEEKASDLHLAALRPPFLRVNGSLKPLSEEPVLTAADVQEALAQVTTERERSFFREHLELDFGYTLSEDIRVRCNAALQRGTISLAMRLIQSAIPGFEELNLPGICRDLVLRPRGMVIVSGPTGSGKSTTLAAMIDYLNKNQSRRVVTIEDPIEYIHASDKCTIIQRELGDDTLTFVDALRHVLRQDPDVILVGEVRDRETAAAALTVAETGHLVLTTGHAPSAPQTIERIVDMFPPHERYLAQNRLASLLIGILCQALVPTVPGAAAPRMPAVEVMLANTAIRNLIREGKIHQLPNAIRTESKSGMELLDHSLVNLYRQRLISEESLYAFCNDRAEVEKACAELDKTGRKGGDRLPTTAAANSPVAQEVYNYRR